MELKNIIQTIYNALDDKKAIDIKIIDIQGLSVMADYFIVASADNSNQMNALLNEVDYKMHELGLEPKQVEGNRKSTWILMDYEDVIVHLFSEEDRLFYDLERVWADGREVSLKDIK